MKLSPDESNQVALFGRLIKLEFWFVLAFGGQAILKLASPIFDSSVPWMNAIRDGGGLVGVIFMLHLYSSIAKSLLKIVGRVETSGS